MRILRLLMADRVIRWGILAGLALLIAAAVFVATRADLADPRTPLHYNIYFGIDLIGPGGALWAPLGIVALTWLVHVLLAGLIIERERTAARLLAWFAVVVIGFAAAATILVLTYAP